MPKHKPPSDRQLRVLALALRYGRQGAEVRLGLAHGTVRNHLTELYRRLGAGSSTDAAEKIGWLKIPEEYVPPVQYTEVVRYVDTDRLADAVLAYVVGVVEEGVREGRIKCACDKRDNIYQRNILE